MNDEEAYEQEVLDDGFQSNYDEEDLGFIDEL
jgi:hypothetical protein